MYSGAGVGDLLAGLAHHCVDVSACSSQTLGDAFSFAGESFADIAALRGDPGEVEGGVHRGVDNRAAGAQYGAGDIGSADDDGVGQYGLAVDVLADGAADAVSGGTKVFAEAVTGGLQRLGSVAPSWISLMTVAGECASRVDISVAAPSSSPVSPWPASSWRVRTWRTASVRLGSAASAGSSMLTTSAVTSTGSSRMTSDVAVRVSESGMEEVHSV